MVREDFISFVSYSVYGVAVTAVMDIWGSLATGGTTTVYTSYGLPQNKFFLNYYLELQIYNILPVEQ